MKCPKCKTKNITKANYCINCKRKFTEEEQEKAYKRSIFYYLEKIEDWYSKITLEVITDHILFKIGSLLIVLGIGIYYLLVFGINTSILKSKQYDLFYNKNKDEYYLLVKDNIDKVNLSLYIPNRLKSLNINHYDINNKLINKVKYKKKKNIKLKTYNDDYYLLISKYKNKKKDKIKLYVYHENDIDKGELK